MPRHQSIVRGLTTRFEQSTDLNNDAVWLKTIMCICMYCTRNFWSTNMLPHHRSTVHKNFSSIESWHLISSMPHHRSMPCHHSVYVNSVVNSNMDKTVHVNNDIFSFILLLRLSTVLSSKVMFVFPSDLSFIVKWP